MDAKYWNTVYSKKKEDEVSWYQEVPEQSLRLIDELKLKSSDSIIDIGGGSSHLVDCLLERGFSDLTVLDISEESLRRTKDRLGRNAASVKFIDCDITQFKTSRQFNLWHDRATLHFLTDPTDVQKYLEIAASAIKPGGYLIVSTFSKSGPDKCSGLHVHQYSDTELKLLFQKYFENTKCIDDVHQTPSGLQQNFVFCGFRKR